MSAGIDDRFGDGGASHTGVYAGRCDAAAAPGGPTGTEA